MSQPPARHNFTQTLLIMAIVFMAMQFFFLYQARPPADPRSQPEIFASLQRLNATMQDVDFGRAMAAYRRSVEALDVPPEQRDWLKLEAQLLLADTEIKSALYFEEIGRATVGFNKLNKAYTNLQAQYDRWSRTELWQRPVTVTPRGELTATTVTGEQLYDWVVDQLGTRNQAQVVWGFVPGWHFIDFLVGLTGHMPWVSYTVASLILAFFVRLIVWPLYHKQLVWGRQMQQLTPMIKEIQAKHTDKKTNRVANPQEFQAEMMKLYREYGLNPVQGCVPALIQMPLFLLIYQCMLLYRFNFQEGYFVWIHPGSTSFLGIPLAQNLGERDFILVAVYGVSMLVTTLLTPITDPTNARQQRILGLSLMAFFSIIMFFWPIPSAFVLYWIFTNMFATAQSLIGYRMPVPPITKKNAPHGAVFPTGPEVKTSGFAGMSAKVIDEPKKGAKNLPKKRSLGNKGKGSPPAPEADGKKKPKRG